ncbi:hypothetical protein ACFO4M_24350 [Pseudonocardia nematodicida]|uniref:hypothetical protein n=1 Tax=Pseudonocardia nematodicida TaxID=1206997 RepID=UPI003612E032
MLLLSSSPSFDIARYPQAAAVLQTGRGDTDTVLDEGTFVKRDGTLVAATAPVLADLTETRNRLFADLDLPLLRHRPGCHHLPATKVGGPGVGNGSPERLPFRRTGRSTGIAGRGHRWVPAAGEDGSEQVSRLR